MLVEAAAGWRMKPARAAGARPNSRATARAASAAGGVMRAKSLPSFRCGEGIRAVYTQGKKSPHAALAGGRSILVPARGAGVPGPSRAALLAVHFLPEVGRRLPVDHLQGRQGA